MTEDARVRRFWVRSVAAGAAIGLLCLSATIAAPVAQAAGGSYTVRSAGDQGDLHPGDGICLTSVGTCTLRAALTEANADQGPSSVSFAIPGTGTHTISITTALPTLTDLSGGTTIDGYTQAGASPNTDPVVDNAQLRVEVKGTGSLGPDGLDIASPGNVVRGLAFYNLQFAINMIFGGDSNAIVGDFIATNTAATFKNTLQSGHASGVVIDQDAKDNFVGRPNAADRNVISGGAGRGVMLKDAVSNNTIQNNIIGLTPNGKARLPNADHAVDVNSSASNTLIGGTGPMEGNLLSGNDGHGVEVSHPPCCGQSGSTADNKIIGNRIGTDPSGNAGPAYAQNGNRFSHENVHVEDHVIRTLIDSNIIGNSALGGIKVDSGSSDTWILRNRIGVSGNGTAISNGPYGVQIELGSHGTYVGPANIIANNRSGIRLQDDTTIDNTISQNSIFGNQRLGIDIAPFDVVNDASHNSATNGGILAPVLTSATNTSVSGVTCAGCRVEVFVADSTTTDPSLESSYGEGRTFLGAGNAGGGGAFDVQIPSSSAQRVVTSTVTDAAGNTSEFSLNRVAPK